MDRQIDPLPASSIRVATGSVVTSELWTPRQPSHSTPVATAPSCIVGQLHGAAGFDARAGR
jgi:hypothetical protein